LLSKQKCWIDNRFDKVDGQWRILVKRNCDLGVASIEEPILVICKPPSLPTVTLSFPWYGC